MVLIDKVTGRQLWPHHTESIGGDAPYLDWWHHGVIWVADENGCPKGQGGALHLKHSFEAGAFEARSRRWEVVSGGRFELCQVHLLVQVSAGPSQQTPSFGGQWRPFSEGLLVLTLGAQHRCFLGLLGFPSHFLNILFWKTSNLWKSWKDSEFSLRLDFLVINILHLFFLSVNIHILFSTCSCSCCIIGDQVADGMIHNISASIF